MSAALGSPAWIGTDRLSGRDSNLLRRALPAATAAHAIVGVLLLVWPQAATRTPGMPNAVAVTIVSQGPSTAATETPARQAAFQDLQSQTAAPPEQTANQSTQLSRSSLTTLLDHGQDAETRPASASAGARGDQDPFARMTVTWNDNTPANLRAQIAPCWASGRTKPLKVQFALERNGEILGTPSPVRSIFDGPLTDAEKAAISAIEGCGPYPPAGGPRSYVIELR